MLLLNVSALTVHPEAQPQSFTAFATFHQAAYIQATKALRTRRPIIIHPSIQAIYYISGFPHEEANRSGHHTIAVDDARRYYFLDHTRDGEVYSVHQANIESGTSIKDALALISSITRKELEGDITHRLKGEGEVYITVRLNSRTSTTEPITRKQARAWLRSQGMTIKATYVTTDPETGDIEVHLPGFTNNKAQREDIYHNALSL